MLRWMKGARKNLRHSDSLLDDGKELVEMVVGDQEGPSNVEEMVAQKLDIGSGENHIEIVVENNSERENISLM